MYKIVLYRSKMRSLKIFMVFILSGFLSCLFAFMFYSLVGQDKIILSEWINAFGFIFVCCGVIVSTAYTIVFIRI